VSDVILNHVGDVQKFVTNAPTVLTNSSGASVTYRLTPYTADNLHVLADDGTVTLPPGMVVEFMSTPPVAITAQEPALYTDAAFEDEDHAINTTDKYTSKQVWDVTTGAPVYAGGSAVGDVWVDATGATVYTPV
jgi:hypothetical protein